MVDIRSVSKQMDAGKISKKIPMQTLSFVGAVATRNIAPESLSQVYVNAFTDETKSRLTMAIILQWFMVYYSFRLGGNVHESGRRQKESSSLCSELRRAELHETVNNDFSY